MRRLAGAVESLQHHPPVAHEAGEDLQRDVRIETVGRIDLRHMVIAFTERRHLQVAVDTEDLAHRHQAIRFDLRNLSHCSVTPLIIAGRAPWRVLARMDKYRRPIGRNPDNRQ